MATSMVRASTNDGVITTADMNALIRDSKGEDGLTAREKRRTDPRLKGTAFGAAAGAALAGSAAPIVFDHKIGTLGNALAIASLGAVVLGTTFAGYRIGVKVAGRPETQGYHQVNVSHWDAAQRLRQVNPDVYARIDDVVKPSGLDPNWSSTTARIDIAKNSIALHTTSDRWIRAELNPSAEN